MVAFSAAPGEDQLEAEFEGDLPPLSDEEFQAANDRFSEPAGAATVIDGHPVIKANFVFIEDHSMDLYLNKIRNLNNPAEAQPKLESIR